MSKRMRATIVILLVVNAATLGWNLSFLRAGGNPLSIFGVGLAALAIAALLYTWRRFA